MLGHPSVGEALSSGSTQDPPARPAPRAPYLAWLPSTSSPPRPFSWSTSWRSFSISSDRRPCATRTGGGRGREGGEGQRGQQSWGEAEERPAKSQARPRSHRETRSNGERAGQHWPGAGGSIWGQTLPEGLLSPRCTPRMACKAGPVPSGRHGHCGGRHSGRPSQNHWLARQVLVLSASPGPTPLRPMPRPELWPQFLLHVGV